MRIIRKACVAMLGALALAACSSTPGATELDPIEAPLSRPTGAGGAESPPAAEPEPTSRPVAPAPRIDDAVGTSPESGSATGTDTGTEPEITYRELEFRGVRGGQLEVILPGSLDDVLAMLLDYDGADGNRAWARSHRTLERDERRVRAHWDFEGRLGIDPQVELQFDVTEHTAERAVVRYKLVKADYGLAAFFGDFHLFARPAPEIGTRLVERVFIHSGITIADASAEDIEQGLREDARLMQRWIEARARD